MHIATVCKSKKRCVQCREEHDYGKCEEGVKVKCCNCDGSCSLAFGCCEVRKRAAVIQQEVNRNNISYAKAVKMVDKER